MDIHENALFFYLYPVKISVMRYLFVTCWCVCLLLGCSPEKPPSETTAAGEQAQAIVDKAIEAHGGKNFQELQVAFDFRNRHYTAERKGGLYTYTRSFTDSTGQVKDILTNRGFVRKVNGQEVTLPKNREQAFSESVNSVIYFALLPYGLNDPAVQKAYLGKTTIRQQPYHKIKITFAQEGGGVDYEDEFVFWIHEKTYLVDYLAYSYHTNEVGLRFREAYNSQLVGGIRFQQYINYKPADQQIAVTELDKLFEAGKLEELSRIELENIRVKK